MKVRLSIIPPASRPLRAPVSSAGHFTALLRRLAMGAGGVLAVSCLMVGAWSAESVSPSAGPARPAVGELRAELTRILSQPAYQWPDQTDHSWQLQLIRRLVQWWQQQVAPRLNYFYEASPVVYWLLVSVLLAGCILILYHLYLSLRNAFGGAEGQQLQRGEAGRSEVEGSPEALLAAADRAARERHFRRALRCLYLAVIRHLERCQLLHYDTSRSNGEYLRDLSPYPRLQVLAGRITELAEGVWYGGRRAGWEEYQRCRQWALEAWREGEGSS